MKSRLDSRFWAALSLVAAAALARVIPHPSDVTPIAAMALFSGAAFQRKPWAVLIPLLAMFISDLAIGTHDQMVSVYGSIVLISFIGFALSKKRTWGRVILASILSSTVFFLMTNFTVWLTTEMYAKTSAGLVECYTMALPFYRNGLIGDLAFSAILFGAWAWITSSQVSKAKGTI